MYSYEISLQLIEPYYNGLGAHLQWNVKHKITLSPKEYLRLKITYKCVEEPKEIIAVLNKKSDVDKIYLCITSDKESNPRSYIDIVNKNNLPVVSYQSEFVDYKCNMLLLYSKNKIPIKLEEETVFATTYQKEGFSLKSRKFTYRSKLAKLPPVELKITLEITKLSESFVLKRNFNTELKKMTLKEQHEWLLEKRKGRINLFKAKLIPLGDLNIIQAYLAVSYLKLERKKVKNTIERNKLDQVIKKNEKTLELLQL